ncbi:MAG: hypothetical protein NVS2B3_01670 [Vulcanimicrobiaceae bacterium]
MARVARASIIRSATETVRARRSPPHPRRSGCGEDHPAKPHASCAAAAISHAPSRTLHRSYLELGGIDEPEDGGVTHVRPIATHGTMFLASGFVLEKLLEPRPPLDADSSYGGFG